jgi:hypothetical protein
MYLESEELYSTANSSKNIMNQDDNKNVFLDDRVSYELQYVSCASRLCCLRSETRQSLLV